MCNGEELHSQKISSEMENVLYVLARRSSGRIKRLGKIERIAKPRVASKGFRSDYSRGNRWRAAHFLGPTSSSSREWIFHLERSSRPNEREKGETWKRDILNYEYFIDGNHPRAIPRRRWNSSLGFSTSFFPPSHPFFFASSIPSRLLKSNAQNGWPISPLSGRQKKRNRKGGKRRRNV